MPPPDERLLHRRHARDIDDEARGESAQVEASVRGVGEGGEVGLLALALLQRVAGAGERGLGGAKDCVGPPAVRWGSQPRCANDPLDMVASCLCDGGAAAQAIGSYDHLGQSGLCPGANALLGEARNRIGLGVERMGFATQRHHSTDRNVVLQPTPALPVSALAGEVGVVPQDEPLSPGAVQLASHGVVDLVVQQPGGRVTHAQIAYENRSRQSELALTDEVHGLEPSRQRQLGALHDRYRGQGGRMQAASALEQHAATVTDHVVLRAARASRSAP